MAVVSISREVPIKQFQIYALRQSENTSQVAEIVNGVYGADTIIVKYVQFWFGRFRSDISDVKNAPRTGSPVVDNVNKISETIEIDRLAVVASRELKIDH
ncbi:hypothetical protein TNCV_2253341 [Trichonephila clavipes]|nr:hypothetical protein TNCV_2253341 [Trichonephila clavipes]